MVEYNIVQHCRMCKKRYVVKKSEAKKYYCDDCEKKAESKKE